MFSAHASIARAGFSREAGAILRDCGSGPMTTSDISVAVGIIFHRIVKWKHAHEMDWQRFRPGASMSLIDTLVEGQGCLDIFVASAGGATAVAVYAGVVHDPLAAVLLSIVIILAAAKIGGHVAVRFGQPPVLGELLAGVVLGNLPYVGMSRFDELRADPAIDVLAGLGLIILLFQVGLESSVGQMLKVGVSSLLVATLGVIAPFVLGWLVGAWLLPDAGIYTHLFLGATLTATSVGITARVLKDIGRSQSDEARIILGAAVIDDVQGLVILAVMSGVIASATLGTSMSYGAVGLVLFKATAFLVGALVIGMYVSRGLFNVASKLEASGVLLAAGLAFCFLLAWLADAIGLAPIVGAFAAGLVLEDLHYRGFVSRGEQTLDALIEPIAAFLVPIFFVLIGLRTDLTVFGDRSVLLLAAALTVAAIIGKQISALGAVGKKLDRLSIAIGMIPRGEVGLIFANMGLTLVVAGRPVVSSAVFSAVVVMVIITTLITPAALKWSFSRAKNRVKG
jgi:Kef-type K+ transport system membrane component KefB